mmetsp:Transcript_25778/g.81819  ORF Transcript_25778/g.81819 Transcript_25778/m.81819 type:complete len:223 (+) Transcript_25778:199-867(+)
MSYGGLHPLQGLHLQVGRLRPRLAERQRPRCTPAAEAWPWTARHPSRARSPRRVHLQLQPGPLWPWPAVARWAGGRTWMGLGRGRRVQGPRGWTAGTTWRGWSSAGGSTRTSGLPSGCPPGTIRVRRCTSGTSRRRPPPCARTTASLSPSSPGRRRTSPPATTRRRSSLASAASLWTRSSPGPSSTSWPALPRGLLQKGRARRSSSWRWTPLRPKASPPSPR